MSSTVDSYQAWLARAESSLTLARSRPAETVFYEDLCFQAQQAAEKALKALLLSYGIDAPRTHNLLVLIELLLPHTEVPPAVADAVELTNYSVELRYPGIYAPVTEKEHGRAVEIAESVVKWVRVRIASRTGESN